MEKSSLTCATSTSALSRKGKSIAKSSPSMCNAVKRSSIRRSERLKKRPHLLKMVEDDKQDEKEEVDEKIGALKQIVPGGEDLGVDMLFEKTAAYILVLQLQIKALNYLTTFVQGSEDEQRKLGG